MQKLFLTVVVSILFISSAVAQISGVENAERYRVYTKTVLENSNTTSNPNESYSNSGLIQQRSNSQLEEDLTA
jgi:hypothetical protein